MGMTIPPELRGVHFQGEYAKGGYYPTLDGANLMDIRT